jgi:hypothetical protein
VNAQRRRSIEPCEMGRKVMAGSGEKQEEKGCETSKQIGARKRAEREEPAASRRRAVGPCLLLEIAATGRIALAPRRRGLEGRRADGGGRSGREGREGAAVGRAGDAGAHRGTRGDRAGGRRRPPQRQDDVGGGGRAAPGARVPPHRRPVQVQMEEPRQPLQGNPGFCFSKELCIVVSISLNWLCVLGTIGATTFLYCCCDNGKVTCIAGYLIRDYVMFRLRAPNCPSFLYSSFQGC